MGGGRLILASLVQIQSLSLVKAQSQLSPNTIAIWNWLIPQKYVSANVTHLGFCSFSFLCTYWGKYLNTLEFLRSSIINEYCMLSVNGKMLSLSQRKHRRSTLAIEMLKKCKENPFMQRVVKNYMALYCDSFFYLCVCTTGQSYFCVDSVCLCMLVAGDCPDILFS